MTTITTISVYPITAIVTMTETTTIEITREQWKELNSRKEPGDGMKDVIARLLSENSGESLEEPETSRETVERARETTETTPWFESVDTPPSSNRDAFEDAARALESEVRERGSITRSEATDALHDTHPAGYSNGRTWWRRVSRPLLEAHPEVSPPPEGGARWRVD
jgi:predicted CopG family antitoxin